MAKRNPNTLAAVAANVEAEVAAASIPQLDELEALILEAEQNGSDDIIPAGTYNLKVDTYDDTYTATGRRAIVLHLKLDENHRTIQHWVCRGLDSSPKEKTMDWHFAKTLRAAQGGTVNATVVHQAGPNGQTYANIERIDYSS